MEYKDSYEFIETNDSWKEGGEYYDGDTDKIVREVLLYEDMSGDPVYVDFYGHTRYPYTIEVDGAVYRDIWFGPKSGVMWGRNTRQVEVIVPCQPVNGHDKAVRMLGRIDYDTNGNDRAKVYWDLAEMVTKEYEKVIDEASRKLARN